MTAMTSINSDQESRPGSVGRRLMRRYVIIRNRICRGCRQASQRTRTVCAFADRSEFDVHQGPDQPIASFLVDSRAPEAALILEQLLLGIMVLAVTLLLLPFLMVMAGVGAVTLLWFVVCAAVLGAVIFWVVFPGAYGLAILLLALVIGLLLVDRQTRHGAP